jgi:hypothetical protein
LDNISGFKVIKYNTASSKEFLGCTSTGEAAQALEGQPLKLKMPFIVVCSGFPSTLIR